MKNYIEEKTFEKTDFSIQKPEKGSYESCRFLNCNFANVILAGIYFCESEFIGCNFSSANLETTGFRDVVFKDCKMLGLRFDLADTFLFEIKPENCVLNHSSFYKTRLKKTIFKKCLLLEVDFTEADLSGSVFDDCELTNALFDRTNLVKADFRTAYNYSIDPGINSVKKARFSVSGIAGLLHRYDIIVE